MVESHSSTIKRSSVSSSKLTKQMMNEGGSEVSSISGNKTIHNNSSTSQDAHELNADKKVNQTKNKLAFIDSDYNHMQENNSTPKPQSIPIVSNKPKIDAKLVKIQHFPPNTNKQFINRNMIPKEVSHFNNKNNNNNSNNQNRNNESTIEQSQKPNIQQTQKHINPISDDASDHLSTASTEQLIKKVTNIIILRLVM